MSVTFDGLTLVKPRVMSREYPTRANEAITVSGKSSMQGSTNYGFRVTIRCTTETHSDVDAVLAKIGVKGTLTLGSETPRTKCMIIGIPKEEDVMGNGTLWHLTVTFAQETV